MVIRCIYIFHQFIQKLRYVAIFRWNIIRISRLGIIHLAQQLACTVARQRLGAELHCAHTLVQRQGAVCLGDKVPHLLLFVLVAIDHHADLLAHFFYNTFLHGFALAHDAFQLFGADVLAAVQNDEVLLAAGQEIVAVLVLAGQIASVEPAVRVNDLGVVQSKTGIKL